MAITLSTRFEADEFERISKAREVSGLSASDIMRRATLAVVDRILAAPPPDWFGENQPQETETA